MNELFDQTQVLYDRLQAAKLLQICAITLDRYRKAGKISYIKIGSSIRYSQKDLDEFITNMRIKATA